MNNEADSEFKKKSKFTTLYPEYKTVEKNQKSLLYIRSIKL